jgi:hypothetical protein
MSKNICFLSFLDGIWLIGVTFGLKVSEMFSRQPNGKTKTNYQYNVMIS